MGKFKIAIVGSRTFHSYSCIEEFVLRKIDTENISCVVSGAAKGVDTLARKFAHKHNLEMIEFPAEWKKYGAAAGPIRNTKIVEEADIVFAFPTKSSTGTYDSIRKARKLQKIVHINKIS